MRGLRVCNVNPPFRLELADIPVPEPAAGEALVQVCAAGVTPTELLWYPTTHTKAGEMRPGAVPSHEFSGRIAALGPEVVSVSVGQEVYGMNDWFADGAIAEYCLTRPEWITQKPDTLSHAQAASVPISALTAWQGLFDRAHLSPGDRVLIHGGAGSVAVFAIQLAKWRGAHVITTVSASNAALVRDLGSDETIDYRSVHFEDIVHDVDVVFDAVGGETLARSWTVLKPGGRMVTIATESSTSEHDRTKSAFFIVEPKRDQLLEIGRLLDTRSIRAVVDDVVPLTRAAEAYSTNAPRRHHGKLVVTIADCAT